MRVTCDSGGPLSHSATTSAGFNSHTLWDFSSWPWNLALGSPGWGRDPSLLQGSPQLRHPSRCSPPHAGAGLACSASSPSCQSPGGSSVCVQLWGFCSARLQVSPSDVCPVVQGNFDAVVRGGEHRIYLLRHLGRKLPGVSVHLSREGGGRACLSIVVEVDNLFHTPAGTGPKANL